MAQQRRSEPASLIFVDYGEGNFRLTRLADHVTSAADDSVLPILFRQGDQSDMAREIDVQIE